jgi:glucose-6-phosphate 1-dehydrogenase
MAKESDGWCRVVIEKPFGHDLASARELNAAIRSVLDEDQIYRIDHYLGKETVQNILIFRFANAIFEPVWNRNYIDHVEITAAETVGIGHRAGYYDSAGVMRDMFQNHLMQLMALVAMEPPVSSDANALRNEKAKVLAAVRPVSLENVGKQSVRGQYEGYRQTEGVAQDSTTATFAALKLYVDNWRWQGVPFYLRSGKKLPQKTTEVSVHFKCPPHLLFDMQSSKDLTANYISLCIQPDEGVHLRFEVKVPDTASKMRSVDMEFHYLDAFGPMAIPEAYERLLLDALHGDAALFTRADEIEYSWKIVDNVLKGWQTEYGAPLHPYEPGTWGPVAADTFLDDVEASWTMGCTD